MSLTTSNTQLSNSTTISDIDNNIPENIMKWKNIIESKQFFTQIQTILPSINTFENDILQQSPSQNAGKRKTKKYKKIIGKTRKYFRKGGNGNNINNLKLIFLAVLLVSLLVVKSDDVPNFFENLLLYPQAMYTYLIIPFFGVINNILEITNIKQSLGYEIIKKTSTVILIPTGVAVYSKFIKSLTGDPLALNGIWGLYLNGTKLMNYLSSMYTSSEPEISQSQSQLVIEDTINSLNNMAIEVVNPKKLPNNNYSNFSNINKKILDIPNGSQILISRDESLCD